MKNFIKIASILLLIASFTQNTNAQSAIGGGISFYTGNGNSEIGINARGAFGIAENMEIVPGINYYLTDGYTLMGFNGDFHYLFGDEESFRFYP